MTEAIEPELPRGIALAWGVASSPQRGPKREMSVERIVEAAMEIADAEGLGAVSMSAVAARLGYTPMSLYRYVSAKDDLVLLMGEEATGLPSEEAQRGGWREQLEAMYREMVGLYLAHPWMIDIPITGSPATPNSSAWMDAGLAALAETPLDMRERMAIVLLVTGQARWTGIVFAGYARTRRESGLTDEQVAQREDAVFRGLVTEDAYPQLRAAIDAGVFLSDYPEPFSFGLERSLDGVAAYMEVVAQRRPAPTGPGAREHEPEEVTADKRVREARKAVREAEKALRLARKLERQATREAGERLRRAR